MNGRPFEKWEALGNDFILVLASEGWGSLPEEEAARLCDRHRGVGADGVMVLHPAGRTAKVALHNQDGRLAEFSGNGFRCAIASLAARLGGTEPVNLEGPRGSYAGWLDGDGVPVLEVDREQVRPVVRPYEPRPAALPLLESLRAELGELEAAEVEVGNPHLILQLSSAPTGGVERFDTLCDRLRFLAGPDERGINLSMTWMLGEGRVHVATWERGVGRTQACASASLATWCLLESRSSGGFLAISLAGGELGIGPSTKRHATEDRNRYIEIRGRARQVFTGVLTGST